MKFKFLEHPADIKFQAFGKTLEEAFINSALALKQTIYEKKIKEKKAKKIKLEAKDKEALLYDFLEQFLFLLDAEDFLFNKIKKLKINQNALEAEISGDKASDYDFNNNVKAITYSNMFVKKQKDKYTTQVVLDV
jgi:SHS2 domain-containing protein